MEWKPTRIFDLDEKLHYGLRAGSLTVIAGRPGMGKTSFALQIAGNMASHGYKVLYFSFEMTLTQAKARLKLQRKNIPSENLIIVDIPGTKIGIEEISEMLTKLGQIDVIFIDYLQLFDYHRSYDKSNAIKDFAVDTGIPIIITSQLQRREDPPLSAPWVPDLTDIRKSGTLESNADVIIFPYHADKNAGLSAEDHKDGLIVAKTPSGQTCFIPAKWDGLRMMFDINSVAVENEDNKDCDKEEYLVVFNLEGQFTAHVNASSIDEAKALAMHRWMLADFGEIHHIDGDIHHVENMYGDILWECK